MADGGTCGIISGIKEVDSYSTLDNIDTTSMPPFREKLIKSSDTARVKQLELEPEVVRLELILGPMGSGKSTELGRRLERKSMYKRTLAVTTTEDSRYGEEGIITHNGRKYTALRITNLTELISNEQYKNAEVIGIDEGNFFPEIPEFIEEQLEKSNKTFIVAGLDANKNRNFFGTLHNLIPIADRKSFLLALCSRCADGTEAPFTIEKEPFTETKKVGGAELYEAVCRKHYDEISDSRNSN